MVLKIPLGSISQDLDIQVNSLAITEVLNPWANEKFPELPTRLAVEKKPTTKFRVMDLLYLGLRASASDRQATVGKGEQK